MERTVSMKGQSFDSEATTREITVREITATISAVTLRAIDEVAPAPRTSLHLAAYVSILCLEVCCISILATVLVLM